MATVSIVGLDRAEVLAALYNASRPQGLGFLHYTPTPMTRDEAASLLPSGGSNYFDYLNGRVMKISLQSDVEVETRLYDRDNGEGAGERVIAALRAGKGVNPESVRELHRSGVADAAAAARRGMSEATTHSEFGDVPVISLGLDDTAGVLAPAVDRATSEDDDKPA